MSKIKPEPYTLEGYQNSDIHILRGSDQLIIRIIGGTTGFFTMPKNGKLNNFAKLFSYNHNYNKSSIITIGNPVDGFIDPDLIKNTLAKLRDVDLASISKICVLLQAHGNIVDGDFQVTTNNGGFMIPPIGLTKDKFFEQLLPFASKFGKPIDFVSINCHGGHLHLSPVWAEFPVGSRLLTYSPPETPTNWMTLYNAPVVDLDELDGSILDKAVVLSSFSQQQPTQHNIITITAVSPHKVISSLLDFSKIKIYLAKHCDGDFESSILFKKLQSLGIDPAEKIRALDFGSKTPMTMHDFCLSESDLLYFTSALTYFEDDDFYIYKNIIKEFIAKTIAPGTSASKKVTHLILDYCEPSSEELSSSIVEVVGELALHSEE